ncbi:hypothetical protein [Stappia sp. ES.058]|uniref:hypothetical protein n=1 Tax=Stappia sp. ES.058 TaxID=1881061 RepID=UPI0012FE6E7D|nr:hypothetical protein [Stappia sp. ES.058]
MREAKASATAFSSIAGSRLSVRLLASTVLCAASLLPWPGDPAHAATYTVTQATDDGTGGTPGSLSHAIASATSDGDEIEIAPGISEIVVSGPLPDISAAIRIKSDHAVEITGAALTSTVSKSLQFDGVSSDVPLTTDLSGTFNGTGSSVVSGMGFVVTSDADLTGASGASGQSGNGTIQVGGAGGSGGVGVSGSLFSWSNSGTVAGGIGGVGGAGGSYGVIADGGDGGTGGDGVSGDNITLVNSKTIAGGLAADGVTRANAILFTSGVNSLELQEGYVINGTVFANGTSDTLILGGAVDATFDASLIGAQYSGFETFAKTGSSTWTVTGTSGFAGTTEIREGTLNLNSNFSSAISVFSGGTLSGTGTVSNVTLNSGAKVAPGSSIGTLNVAGDLSFVSGSTYEVEVDKPGHSDKILATGTVTIDSGATLSIRAENGTDDGSTYNVSTDYTIISADAIAGSSFGTVTENFAFLDASVAYSATEVILTLSRSASAFTDKAATPNQKNTAKAIGTLGSGPCTPVPVLSDCPRGRPNRPFRSFPARPMRACRARSWSAPGLTAPRSTSAF